MNILNKLTRNSLKMNKKRTLFTVIGIILTGAMISGVTTLAVSFQDFLVDAERATSGDWEISYQNIKYSKIKTIEDSKEFSDILVTKNMGLMEIENVPDRYIEMRGYTDKAIENFKVEVVEGRFPQNDNEIVIADRTNKDLGNYKVGDKLKVNLGNMVEISEEENEFKTFQSKEYDIVGIVDNTKSNFITLINKENIKDNEIVNITVKAKKVKNIIERSKELAQENNFYETPEELDMNFQTNEGLLMYQGETDDKTFLGTMYAVCGVLILVVAIGSIVVIYNSFAISVSERVKQFGILASVGATKRQIKRMVIMEGIILGAISSILGIGFGILGIAVTLKIVDRLIATMLVQEIGVHLSLHVSIVSIIIAIILIGLTVIISVLVPAKRASKVSPIEAIRGTKEIKVKARKLHTFKFMRKIYGIEGDLALKNLKRSKKRYRTTVISLVISIVLFLTFNGFVGYMFQGFDAIYRTIESDYLVTCYELIENSDSHKVYKEEIDNVLNELENIEGINRISRAESIGAVLKLNNDNINNSLKKVIDKKEEVKKAYELDDNSEVNLQAYIVYLNNEEFDRYCKQVVVEKLEDNQCILMNHVDGIATAKAEYDIFNYQENDDLLVKLSEECEGTNLKIIKVANKAPFELTETSGYPFIIVNENRFEQFIKEEIDRINAQKGNSDYDKYITRRCDFYIESDNIEKLDEKVPGIIGNLTKVDGFSYMDVATQISTMKNLKTIIQIFLYGFIVLISLIGISNIFNTITTNINLRRREFAVLKSIGMTDKSFIKMLDLECVFYGTKALLYGVPIGVLLCYGLTKLFEETVMIMFTIPWGSILICVVVVYLIVFITMKYATNKVKKENIIDDLRDDNI